MHEWLRRLRGILGLGAVGGVAGALIGALWWVFAPILGVAGVVIGDFWATSLVWGFFGAFASGGAAVLLSAMGRSRSLEELSPWHMGAFGALAGFLAPSAFLLLITGSVWLPGTAVFAVLSSLVGASLGAGLMLTAKRTSSEELPPGDVTSLPPGDDGE